MGTLLNCTLCRRGVGIHRLYGHRVCAKCFYRFINRRQLAALIDVAILIVLAFYADELLLDSTGWRLGRMDVWTYSALLIDPWVVLFMLRDGFGFPSPGRLLARIHVVDEKTRRPISLIQSILRNLAFIVGLVPLFGLVLFIAAAILESMLMGMGTHWGDRLAGTKVIWNPYARHSIFGGNALACERCNYELVGNTSGVCPECGTPVSSANAARLGQ